MYLTKPLKKLFLLNSIFVFASAFLGPLYAVYVEGIDSSPITISSSWAVFLISTTVFMYFIAKNGDKIKEKRYLLASGFMVRAIAWLGYVFVTNITGLIIVQILLGLGEALGTPAWNAIFANHLNFHKEIMEYSEWSIVSNIFLAIGTVIGGIIVTYFSFNLLFVLMSIFALISFLGTMIAPKRML